VIVLGIDPGKSGAYAIYDTETTRIFAADAPQVLNQIDPVTFAAELLKFVPDRAVIERVHSMPKQGVASSFNFGLAYGVVLGIVAAMRVPTLHVAPTKWKKHFGLTSDKEQSRNRALQLWPERADLFKRKKDDGRAEAALLAKYGSDSDYFA
jgi:Holliday junction resolvasome RuvABC endonuclease subunit